MSKRSSKKSKRRSKAVPALGITGLSLSLASGAIASTGEAMDVPSTSQPHELFLGEEEIFDTSLLCQREPAFLLPMRIGA